ncbi:SMP-30/gluconolactonase/LRE family protein [Ideonella sp. B7]|uniref:SMP-30/gluconolactonase/LRE family protein n=1 Tax=Ideonella benzenivorans TaxID=2831643 RepID=UPI001CEC209D|nr:SMP-30/gluconolactonase/LRE family protein [Ideonella benzenivorans]MCA6215231.1 SMP-30/gluconolactonase/LRE family protein [Ideonella benzenivorans]
MHTEALFEPLPLPVAPSLLGESPFWHPSERVLYWCDIPGRRLNRFAPQALRHDCWDFDTEPACCMPALGGGLVLGMRDGLWFYRPEAHERTRLVPPPYDPACERFNDGKADPQGRVWVGTLYEPKDRPAAALYRWSRGALDRVAGDITVSNGLAWSPDGRTLYWSDTTSHTIMALDMDPQDGSLSRRRVLQQFPLKTPGQALETYGGRPDGAAVDSEGCYWVAMFEGQRLLRLSPDGAVRQEVPLPVRCPTMPCFGGDDLRTLYLTTARHGRPAAELARQPWAGCVLAMRVAVPGLPVNLAQV